ncbi:myeloid leukemia factor 1 [Microcaecilia unicolor]|uniref:Myeloid leukemia factor 1 n=1 Tax=Microcaecilia unicolor TaxID=1415580 RepID=A0A6P7Z6V7_9AMPH|nr:myeloid leukemia factor 1 [Microcaecilia unicolor]
MRSFSDPFGRDPFLSIQMAEREHMVKRGRHDSQAALRCDQRNGKDPFDMINSMMLDMRNKMFDVQKNFDQFAAGSDAHSFNSSSIKTYSKAGDGPPKVFEASRQTCRAPGGIKETRQAVRDSESGVAKMAVGHHIQDRAHIIEKRMNNKTGNSEVHQEFCNLDESEAPNFDEEWRQKVSKFHTRGSKSHLEAPKHKNVHRAEIKPKAHGLGRQKPHHKSTAEGSRRPKVSCCSPQY